MFDTAYNRKFPSIYRGIVEDNEDPEKLGRCRVRVPSVHGELNFPIEALPWARPIVLSPVKKQRGSVNIPDKGDIVWVLFEGAVREFPIYFGGTYARGELDIDKDIVDFYIEGTDRISYNRVTREYEILTGSSSVRVTPSGVHIKGTTTIEGDLIVAGDISYNYQE